MTENLDHLSRETISHEGGLDLFDAYLSTIASHLNKASDLIQEQFNYRYGNIFGHICGVIDEADIMKARLQKVRAANASRKYVQITFQPKDAERLVFALREIDMLFSSAIDALDMLHKRAKAHVEDAADDVTGDRQTVAVACMAHQAMWRADEQEVAQLRRFTDRLAEAITRTKGEAA